MKSTHGNGGQLLHHHRRCTRCAPCRHHRSECCPRRCRCEPPRAHGCLAAPAHSAHTVHPSWRGKSNAHPSTGTCAQPFGGKSGPVLIYSSSLVTRASVWTALVHGLPAYLLCGCRCRCTLLSSLRVPAVDDRCCKREHQVAPPVAAGIQGGHTHTLQVMQPACMQSRVAMGEALSGCKQGFVRRTAAPTSARCGELAGHHSSGGTLGGGNDQMLLTPTAKQNSSHQRLRNGLHKALT